MLIRSIVSSRHVSASQPPPDRRRAVHTNGECHPERQQRAGRGPDARRQRAGAPEGGRAPRARSRRRRQQQPAHRGRPVQTDHVHACALCRTVPAMAHSDGYMLCSLNRAKHSPTQRNDTPLAAPVRVSASRLSDKRHAAPCNHSVAADSPESAVSRGLDAGKQAHAAGMRCCTVPTACRLSTRQDGQRSRVSTWHASLLARSAAHRRRRLTRRARTQSASRASRGRGARARPGM